MRNLLVIVTMLAVASSACLEDKPGAVGAALDRAALCNYQARCGWIGASEVAACAQRTGGYGAFPLLDGAVLAQEGDGYSTDEAIRAGRLALDSARRDACREAIAAADCGGSQIINCALMFVGRVPAGGACRDDRECTGPGICAVAHGDFGPISGDPGCDGTCESWLATGAACGGGRCAPSDVCDAASQLCRARVSEGGACLAGTFDSDCVAGLVCSEQVCAQPGGEGAQCAATVAPNGGCHTSLRCVAGTCASPGGEGDACEVAVTLGGLGGLGAFFGAACQSGFFCAAASATCEPLRPDGAECTQDALCVDHHPCIGLSIAFGEQPGSPGRCGPWGDLGSACPAAVSVSGCPLDMACDPAALTCAARVTATEPSQCAED